jgi:hypothetical protein
MRSLCNSNEGDYTLFSLNGTIEAFKNSETSDVNSHFVASVKIMDLSNKLIANIDNCDIIYNCRLGQNRKIKSIDQQ